MRTLKKDLLPALALVVALSQLVNVGCAQRYRESSSGRTQAEITAKFQMYLTEANAGKIDAASVQTAQQILMLPNSVTYFAESTRTNRTMGPVNSVIPMEFGFLTSAQTSLPALSVEEASVMLIVSPMGDGQYQGAMFIEFKPLGATATTLSVFTSSGSGFIQDDQFIMNFRSSTGVLAQIQSYDIDETTNVGLHPVLSFDLFDVSNGQSLYRGRANSLEGFGVN
jgi:hypothetical protein